MEPASTTLTCVLEEESHSQMDKRLLKAATFGDSTTMKDMASNNPSILLGTTRLENNCLHIASIHGHMRFCTDVLGVGCSLLSNEDFMSLLSNVNCGKETLLIIAVTHGHSSLAYFFLQQCQRLGLKHAILQQDKKGYNALHHAIRNGDINLALEFISAEPDLSTFLTENGESPMFIAVMRDFKYVSMALLEIPYSADGGNYGRHALHAAARNGNQDITIHIMEKRPHLATQVDNSGRTPIRMAVTYNKVYVLRVLLEYDSSMGYEIDRNDFPLLCSAAQRGQVDVARELLNHCPDALSALYKANDLRDGSTCLHIAVQNGHPEFVKFILMSPQLGKIVNMQDGRGKTALHYAVKLCDPRLVGALLSHKSIDTTVLDGTGSTAASQLTYITDADKTLDWKEVHVLMLKADPKDDDISLYNLRKRAKKEETRESKWERESEILKYTGNTSLVAVLIATITFAAAFTLPGGYSNDAGSAGHPIMSRKIAFQAFLVSDTFAMCSSFVVAFICLMGRWEDDKFTTYYISVTKKLTWFAYMATITAFSTGLYTVLDTPLHWLGVAICSIVAILPVLTMFIWQWPVLKFNFRLGQTWHSLKLKFQFPRAGRSNFHDMV